MITRSAKAKIEILKGEEVLKTGHELARSLWNFVRYCVRLHSQQHYPPPRKLGKRKNKRGEWVDNWQRPVRKNLCQNKLEWPGKYGLDKAFRGSWQGKALSDRCYGGVIRGYAAAYEAFMNKVARGEKARPPHYCENPRALFFDTRNIKSLGNWKFQLTVLGGYGSHRHAIIQLYVRPGIKIRDIRTLTVYPGGECTVTYSVIPRIAPGNNIIAVDLGEVNLVAAVELLGGESVVIRGRNLIESNEKFDDLMAKCKPSGYMGKGHEIKRPKSSPRKKSYQAKQTNCRTLGCHNVTTWLRNWAVEKKANLIVFGEGLGNIPKGNMTKKMNRRLSLWPVGMLRKQSEYKFEEVGIEAVYQNEAYTSQDCYACGRRRKGNRRGDVYTCDNCGAVSHADVNGAINQLANYTGADCSWMNGQPTQTLEFSGNWSLYLV